VRRVHLAPHCAAVALVAGRGGEEQAEEAGGSDSEPEWVGEGLVGRKIRIAYPDEDGKGSTYFPVTVKAFSADTKEHLVQGEDFESREDLHDCHWREAPRSGRGIITHRAAAEAARAVEVADMVKDVSEGTFVAINCGRDEAGFCYWLGKAVKAPYKAKHDWTDHCSTTIKKSDYVIDLVYWDRPSTGDPLLFEDEAKKATVHAEHVLHANVAPAPAADDRVRVSEAVVAEIEAEHELFRNT
jgi:hypothetical protein